MQRRGLVLGLTTLLASTGGCSDDPLPDGGLTLTDTISASATSGDPTGDGDGDPSETESAESGSMSMGSVRCV